MFQFIYKGISSLKKSRLCPFYVGLAFLFCILIFFYDLFKDRFILTERDIAPYFIPFRFFWVENVKIGDIPLWGPYQFSGHPFFANPQYAILYPINGLFFILPFDIAFNTIILIHFFLGGFFTYLFLRDLEASPSGAFIGGLIFMLSGYLLSIHSLLTILLSVVWTPLVIMFFRRAMTKPAIKNEILTAFFMAIAFLGGGVEIVYGNFFILLLMAILSPFFHSFLLKKSIPFMLFWVKRLRSLIIIALIFFFLSAIQLLPFLELWMHSIRSHGISYQEATIWSFAPQDFLLFILPDAYGYFLDMKKYWLSQCWLKTLYTGGLPFVLGLIFFLFPHPNPLPEGEGKRIAFFPYEGEKKRRIPLPLEEGKERGKGGLRGLFFSLMIFSLFLSLGNYNPIYPFLFKYVPFLNGIRYPVKFLYLFILVLSVTAGLGFDKLMELASNGGGKRLKHLFISLSLISGFVLLCTILGHQEISYFLKERGIDFPNYNHISTNLYHLKRFFFYFTLFFLLLRIGYEVKWKIWTQVLLIFFLIADLFGNMGFYGKEKTSDYFQKTRILELISSDPGNFRIFSTPKTISMDTPIFIPDPSPLKALKEKHLPSFNLLYSLRDIWGIDVIRLKRANDLYRALTEMPSISSTPLIDLYGVKYVISVTPIDDSRLELIYSTTGGLPGRREDLLKENTIKLYRNRIPPQRGWLVKKFRVMDSESILKKIRNQEFCLQEEVLLEEEPRTFLLLNTPKSQESFPFMDKIEWISETNNRIHLSVYAGEDSILVLNDTYFPGWKAFIDGKEEKIFRANYNFRAVLIPSGNHQVEFVYDPFSFKLGAWVTSLGVVSCLGIAIFKRQRRRTI